MIIRKATVPETVMCFHRYAEMDDWWPVTTKAAYSFAAAAVTSKMFLRVAEDNGAIVGFLYAEPAELVHMPFQIYQQKYYCSWCPGAKAVRAAKMLHNALFDFAEARGYWMVMSTGSHFDETHRFTKLLERFGWERRGYVAARKTANYRPEALTSGVSLHPRPLACTRTMAPTPAPLGTSRAHRESAPARAAVSAHGSGSNHV